PRKRNANLLRSLHQTSKTTGKANVQENESQPIPPDNRKRLVSGQLHKEAAPDKGFRKKSLRKKKFRIRSKLPLPNLVAAVKKPAVPNIAAKSGRPTPMRRSSKCCR